MPRHILVHINMIQALFSRVKVFHLAKIPGNGVPWIALAHSCKNILISNRPKSREQCASKKNTTSVGKMVGWWVDRASRGVVQNTHQCAFLPGFALKNNLYTKRLWLSLGQKRTLQTTHTKPYKPTVRLVRSARPCEFRQANLKQLKPTKLFTKHNKLENSIPLLLSWTKTHKITQYVHKHTPGVAYKKMARFYDLRHTKPFQPTQTKRQNHKTKTPIRELLPPNSR